MGIHVKILTVDDDETNLLIIREMLEGGDYICRDALSAEEALHILPSFCPDIVLLDIMMPGLNGYELCRKIRTDSRNRFVKVLMVSGKASIEERLEGYDSGADDYIAKPFNSEELLAKIKVFSRLKQAEEVDQVKTTMLQLISHETMTPLTGIQGGAHLLEASDGLTPDQKTFLAMIRDSADRLEKGIKEALFLCHLKGKITLYPFQISLASSLRDLADEAVNRAGRGRGFSLDCPKDLIVLTDWPYLSRALNYVLDNAFKFSPSESTVVLAAQRGPGGCEIRVQDQGKGIARERLPFIFDEFAIQDIQHHRMGLGLSLAICRHIMEHLGGSVEASSEPGKGATFLLRIP